jgi:putative transposase
LERLELLEAEVSRAVLRGGGDGNTASLPDSRKSTTSKWQLVGFLSHITYIRLQRGFIYLMAVIDWFSRYVLAWEISITLDTSFCLEALDRALCVATPEIFNSDQGVQFTSAEFTNRLKAADIRISWDGRGRALDNIFVERLWRSVKYEEVYIKDYQSVPDAVRNLRDYFTFYNYERLHQALDYQTPAQVYLKG